MSGDPIRPCTRLNLQGSLRLLPAGPFNCGWEVVGGHPGREDNPGAFEHPRQLRSLTADVGLGALSVQRQLGFIELGSPASELLGGFQDAVLEVP